MKLIIDIPEDEVNECKMQVDMIKQEGLLIESLSTALKIHVANGTPLPKGHGRLIDADAVLEEPIGNTYKDIDIAETIVEADKAESEDKE